MGGGDLRPVFGIPLKFNDAGQLLFRGQFNDGSSGIFLAELDDPGPQASLVFREGADSSWFFGDTVPVGFDHVGLHYVGSVYDSHPGYSSQSGYFWDPIRSDLIQVTDLPAVQKEHSLGSFIHGSESLDTDVAKVLEVPIDPALAARMVAIIESHIGTHLLSRKAYNAR